MAKRKGAADDQLAAERVRQAIGGNSVINTDSAKALRGFVERIENLEEQKAALAADAKEVYAEARGTGFDVKILRKVIQRRKQDPARREEEETLIDLYMGAIQMTLDFG